jgi:hypothetical protein
MIIMNTNNSSNKKTQNIRKQKHRKSDQLRLFIFKSGYLNIAVDLQSAFAPETRRADRQWLEERLNMVKLRK